MIPPPTVPVLLDRLCAAVAPDRSHIGFSFSRVSWTSNASDYLSLILPCLFVVSVYCCVHSHDPSRITTSGRYLRSTCLFTTDLFPYFDDPPFSIPAKSELCHRPLRAPVNMCRRCWRALRRVYQEPKSLVPIEGLSARTEAQRCREMRSERRGWNWKAGGE